MKTLRSMLALFTLILVSPVSADLIINGDFEGGLNTSDTTISGTTGPFGEWLAFSGHWEISDGAASNTTSYAENPDHSYLMMQGVDLSAFSTSFDSILSFDYAYEGGYGGIDGRGVRVFGMESGDTQNLFAPWTFASLDLLFSQELSPTGSPTTAFVPYTSTAFLVDPGQYSALLVAFTFGGTPGETLRAVDNVSLSGPTAVPEPSTLALLGLGLVGIAATRRKKSDKK